MALNPTKTAANPRVAKLIELEVEGRIKPEHQTELDTYRAQGLAPKKSSGNSLTEYQGKSTGFYERAIGANRDFLGAGDGGDPVGYGGDIARSILPENVVNSWTSPQRQKAQQAREDFIRASLRYESGAAIGGDEFAAQDKIFFPQTGDSAETIAQKAEARQRVIDSLKVAAGPGADGEKKAEQRGALVPTDVAEAMKAGGISETQAAAYDAFNKANPNATAEQLRAFSTSMGLPLTNADEIVKARNAGGGVLPGATGTIQPPDISDARGNDTALERADTVMRGVADTASLGTADRLSAVGDTLFGGGTMEENLARQRAIDRYDAENSPWLRGAGQLAGGAIMPVGRGATTLRELAGTGAGIGALYGFNSADNWQDSAINAATGAAAGGIGGAAFGKLSELYRGRTPPGGGRGGDAASLLNASNDLKVDVLPADAGGPVAGALSSLFKATPGGTQPLTAQARRIQGQASAALDAMASREGSALTKESAGNAVRDGALKYRSQSRDRIGRLYDDAATAAGDTRIAPKSALESLDRHISELSEIPGGADGLSVLNGLRDELAQRGTVTVQGIRGMRTQLRQKFAKDNLRGSDIERRVGEVVDAASEDLINSLADQGMDSAANLYSRADKEWSNRVRMLDEFIMPIIGKKGDKSGEQIVDGLNAAAKGNNQRLVKLFEALPEQEAGDARATLIQQMGRAGPSNQGAAGDDFSFGTFLTNWNKIGNSAKNSIFRGDNRKAIDQIALLAEKAKAAAKYQNYSNSGSVMLGGATVASGAAGLLTLGKVLAGQYIGGRILASPNVSRALLSIAKAKTPDAVSTRIGNLSSVAARESALSGEISRLQEGLLKAANDNFGRSAAASDHENK